MLHLVIAAPSLYTRIASTLGCVFNADVRLFRQFLVAGRHTTRAAQVQWAHLDARWQR